MAEVLEEGPDTTLDLTNEHLRSLEGVEIKPNLTVRWRAGGTAGGKDPTRAWF